MHKKRENIFLSKELTGSNKIQFFPKMSVLLQTALTAETPGSEGTDLECGSGIDLGSRCTVKIE
jgi:hypothetical protein